MSTIGIRWAMGGLALLTLLLLIIFGPQRRPELWFTPDQRGDQLMSQQKYDEAAKVYADPMRRGIAFYKAGNFKSAATEFSRVATPDSTFNQANALVMLGKYDDAIKAYDRALKLQPHWQEAEDNRAVAVIRRDRLKTTGGDETGGQIKPDEVVYEKGSKKTGDTVQVDEGPPLDDKQLQALWLRRVQTKPADFLRAKFAVQSAQSSDGAAP